MEQVKRNPDYHLDDLSSEFDAQSEAERGAGRKRKRGDFWDKEYPGEIPKPSRSQAKDIFQDEHGRLHRKINRLMQLDAYARHKEMMNLYTLCYPGAAEKYLKRDTSNDRTDYDVLKSNHKFVWSEEEMKDAGNKWESRMAKKYYDKLFKEYCIVDLTFYKENKVAMRWRTEPEVKTGKGQFICGNKKCLADYNLTSWEVNFCYIENKERKSALVKVRLCEECSMKLNYGSQKKKYVKKPREKKHKKRDDEEIPIKKAAIETEETEEKKAKEAAKATTSNEIWTQPITVEAEKSVDDDIDDFLNEIFM